MPDEQPGWVLCIPCQYVRHEDCEGAVVFCMCLAEQMLEAEGLDESRH